MALSIRAGDPIGERNDLIDDRKDPIDERKDVIDDENDLIDDQKDVIDDENDLIDDQKDVIDDEKDLIDDQKDLIDDEKDPIDERKDPIDERIFLSGEPIDSSVPAFGGGTGVNVSNRSPTPVRIDRQTAFWDSSKFQNNVIGPFG